MKKPQFSKRIPPGDQKDRLVCDDCGWIHYENPKIVVGAVATHDGRYLLCRRAIEPAHGRWTITAGYLEERETPEDGAKREAREEANADLTLNGLLGIYSIPRISQVQLIYRGRLVSPDVAAGEESQEVGLFDWADIPWDELAFPSVRWALRRHYEVREDAVVVPGGNPDGELGNY